MKLKHQALAYPLERVKTAGKEYRKNFFNYNEPLLGSFFIFKKKRPRKRPFKCVKEIIILETEFSLYKDSSFIFSRSTIFFRVNKWCYGNTISIII